MARQSRFVITGQPQHVIQRGNNRQDIFLEEADYAFFVEKLTDALEVYQCELHAYVLMTNHVHILITPHTDDGISKVMQVLGRYYVQYFNKKYKRTGTLWEGRYKATLVDSERYFLICMRYIELNPVRAKDMASEPSEYLWSSYRHNALGKIDRMITPHLEYLRLGKTEEIRQINYVSLFEDDISSKTLNDIREATNKAWVLGGSEFKAKVERKMKRPLESKGIGGDRKSELYLKNN